MRLGLLVFLFFHEGNFLIQLVHLARIVFRQLEHTFLVLIYKLLLFLLVLLHDLVQRFLELILARLYLRKGRLYGIYSSLQLAVICFRRLQFFRKVTYLLRLQRQVIDCFL